MNRSIVDGAGLPAPGLRTEAAEPNGMLPPGLRNAWWIIHDLSRISQCPAITSIVDLAARISHADTAQLYSIHAGACELRLVSASPRLEDSRRAGNGREFTAAAKRWLDDLRRPQVLQPADSCFASFRTGEGPAASLLVCPLMDDKPAGVLVVSRTDARAYTSEEIELVAKLGPAMLAVVREREILSELESLRDKLRSARRENAVLEKRLAERKLVERAKGLLQTQYGWTEENAYYYVRRTSRQQRMPMAVIAQRIIDVAAAKQVERERLSA